MANIVIVTSIVNDPVVVSQKDMLINAGHEITILDVATATNAEMANYDLIIAVGYDYSSNSANEIILAYQAGTPLIAGAPFYTSTDRLIQTKLNHGTTSVWSSNIVVKVLENDLFFQSYAPNVNFTAPLNGGRFFRCTLNSETTLDSLLFMADQYDLPVGYLIEKENTKICVMGIFGNTSVFDDKLKSELVNLVNYMSGDSNRLISGFVKIDNEPHSTNVIAVSADLKNPKIVGVTQSDPADGSYSITTVYNKPFMVFTMQDYGLPWSASTAKVIGDVVHPATPNGYIYKTTQAGNTGTAEPIWTAEQNVSINDGSVIYQSERLLKPEIEGYVTPTPIA